MMKLATWLSINLGAAVILCACSSGSNTKPANGYQLNSYTLSTPDDANNCKFKSDGTDIECPPETTSAHFHIRYIARLPRAYLDLSAPTKPSWVTVTAKSECPQVIPQLNSTYHCDFEITRNDNSLQSGMVILKLNGDLGARDFIHIKLNGAAN